MNVNELSAITANLGHITAGLIESVEIYGSYIATNRGAYPRAEMSVNQNMFATYQSDSSYIQIKAVNAGSNSPQMSMVSPGATLNFYLQGSASNVFSTGTDMRISADRHIDLNPGVFSGLVRVTFESLQDNTLGTTLAQQLSSKVSTGTNTGMSQQYNGGIPIGTKLAVDGGGYVVWNGIPPHVHPIN
ncbi:hypothetical protein D3C73_454280 [compost metagenome]